MQKWAIGVFASVDAGLGVHLEVAKELGIHTVQVHTPHQESRNEVLRKRFCNAARTPTSPSLVCSAASRARVTPTSPRQLARSDLFPKRRERLARLR